MRFLKVFCALIIMSSSAYSWAQVNYQISITEPQHHLAQVRAEFQVTEAKPLTLMLPAWRSGKYQILDLANGVRLFQARDQKGQALKFYKKEKKVLSCTFSYEGDRAESLPMAPFGGIWSHREIDQPEVLSSFLEHILWPD